MTLLQTNAALNSGNSGGPLIAAVQGNIALAAAPDHMMVRQNITVLGKDHAGAHGYPLSGEALHRQEGGPL